MNIKKIYKILIPDNIKFYVKALSVLFVIAGVFGFIVAQQFPTESSEAIKNTAKQLAFIKQLGPIEIFFIILLNNSIKAFFMMILGILFGIIPVLFIILNGYVIGVVLAVVASSAGISAVLLGILPHGIFEIFAVLISAGYGVWLGEMFSKKLHKKGVFWEHLKTAMIRYATIILPIIIFAALIETFITKQLLSSFLI